jgi:hypothetical protein
MKAQETLAAGLAEACWIAAVVLVPISCDLLSGQIFTSVKSSLTQTIGTLSILSVALHLLMSGLCNDRNAESKALIFPIPAAIVLLGISFVSWTIALDPSRAGHSESVVSQAPHRLAYLLSVFFATAVFLRTSAQLERLAFAALASGFAVATFALMQQYGFRAPGYAEMTGMEIVSFVGGPIFLAGYLLMLLPLGVWNLSLQLGRARGRITARVATAALLLLVLVMGFLACGKRGPTIGLVTAICAGLALLAAWSRHYRLLIAAATTATLVAVLLTSLAFLRISGVPVEKISLIERLSMIVPIEGRRDHDYRTTLWALLPDLILSPAPLIKPSGDFDPHHALRIWFGFGPDNVQAALPSKYLFLQSWPSDVMEVSCHSHFWDLLLSLGVTGVIAFFALFLAVWYQGLVSIGARPPPILTAATIALTSAGVAGYLVALLFGAGFFGLGAQAGFIASLLGLGLCRHPPSGALLKTKPRRSALLIVALMAALAGHWIDIGFIFPTAENSVLFWVFCGAVAGWRKDAGTGGEDAKAPRRATNAWTAFVGAALLVSVIYARANIGPILNGQLPLASLFGTAPATVAIASLALLCLALVCILFQSFTPAREAVPITESSYRAPLAIGAIYSAGIVCLIKLMLWQRPSPTRAYLADLWAIHFLATTTLGIICFAVWLVAPSQQGRRLLRWQHFASVALAASAIWFVPANDMRSSISSGLSRRLDGDKIEWLERSIRLKPSDVGNYFNVAREVLEPSGDNIPSVSSNRLATAEHFLRNGVSISPFNLLSAKLGKVQLLRALATDDREAKNLATSARQSLAAAVLFAPQNEPAWVDLAFIEQEFFGLHAESASHLAMANKITFSAPESFNIIEQEWGIYYAQAALSEKHPRLRLHYARRAELYLDFDLLPKSEIEFVSYRDLLAGRARSLLYKAMMRTMVDDTDGAADAFTEADNIISAIKLAAPSNRKAVASQRPAADAP